MATSLLAFAKQDVIARSGGDSAFGDAEGLLQLNVQHPSAGNDEGLEAEVAVDVPDVPDAEGSSVAPASLTGELPVGKEGRKGDLKKRKDKEEEEVRRDAVWSENKRNNAKQPKQQADKADKAECDVSILGQIYIYAYMYHTYTHMHTQPPSSTHTNTYTPMHTHLARKYPPLASVANAKGDAAVHRQRSSLLPGLQRLYGLRSNGL